jgi:hypothetical protein
MLLKEQSAAYVDRRFQHTNRWATVLITAFPLPLVAERRSLATS